MGRLSNLQTCAGWLVIAVLAAKAGAQTTWWVDDDAVDDPGPGDPLVSDPLEDGTAAHPFDAIQEAIDAAIDGDEVLIVDGTYTGTGNRGMSFLGKNIVVRSASGNAASCVIDCQAADRAFEFTSGETLAAALQNVTITGGDPGIGSGGAIVIDNGSTPTIFGCIFEGNLAPANGGALHIANTTNPSIDGCSFSNNFATDRGGAIHVLNASPDIVDCTFLEGVADHGGGIFNEAGTPVIELCHFTLCFANADGGAVHNLDGAPDIRQSTFETNSAGVSGGGIYNASGASITVNECAFTDNDATTSGGAVHHQDLGAGAGSLTLLNCDFDDNQATGLSADGGAVTNAGGVLTCQGGSFNTNSATGDGGGIHNDNGTLTVTSVFLAGNSAVSGGAIDNHGGDLTVGNSTITGNEASSRGGGIINEAGDDDLPGDTTITGSTLSFNQAPLGGGLHNTLGSVDVTSTSFEQNTATEGGGAAFESGASGTFQDATFQSNSAVETGGGTFVDGGNATFDTCQWLGNSTTTDVPAGSAGGGGLAAVDGGFVDLTDCTLDANQETDAIGGGGGAILLRNATATIVLSTISNNTSAGNGGGVLATDQAGVTLTSTTLIGNDSASNGGGALINRSSVAVESSRFESNDAFGSGGGLEVVEHITVATITDTLFLNNSCSVRGGGIQIRGATTSTPASTVLDRCSFIGNILGSSKGSAMSLDEGYDVTVTNSVFSGNEATSPGSPNSAAVHIEGTNGAGAFFGNCSFSRNIAQAPGGAVSNIATTPTEFANCVFWANVPDQIFDSGSAFSVTYSDIQGGWAGMGNIDLDPMFADDDGADNLAGTEDDDLRLLAGSPCIDAGRNAMVPAGIILDLDQDPRFVDDPGTADTGVGTAPIVDMGAHEFALCPADVNGDTVVDILDLLDLLAAWGPCPGGGDPCPADVNGDTVVDILDLLDVLAAWGSCP